LKVFTRFGPFRRAAYAGDPMIEALWVFGAVALLVAAGTASVVLPPEWLIFGGMIAMAVGSVFGFPTGFYYHVRLRRELLRIGALPERWWLHPVRHHDLLEADALRRVTPWFYVGGAGFVLILAGAASVGLGLLRFDVGNS
jgi:hypothetical protein